MKKVKKYIGLITLVLVAVLAVIGDILIQSNHTVFNEINRILFTLVTVVAGFWVTCYLLFIQMYKDRYPLKFIENSYMPQMKYNMTYIIYSIIYGCFIIVKNGGIIENIWYATSALFTVFIVLKHIYNTNKTMMVNTYIDDFCRNISKKLDDKENGVKKGVFKNLRYVLDECVVKEEYYIAQNISKKLGEVFRDFMKNSIAFIDNGTERKEVEDSFERIVNVGTYQLELCKDISSKILIGEIVSQQIKNIEFCIETNQYEWFKKYIDSLSMLTFQKQRKGEDKVVGEVFSIYTNVLDKLIEEKKEEWIKYMLSKLYFMTMSLNFLVNNTNIKHFASVVVYGLVNCKDDKIYELIYEMFEKLTRAASNISNGFLDIKVYYALLFNELIREGDQKHLKSFFDTIFKYGQDLGNDITWTEFKFYCIRELLDEKDTKYNIDIDKFHIRLLVEVIEMKEQYKGYMFLPQFEEKMKEEQYRIDGCKKICEDISYLLSRCIINDNLPLFCVALKDVNTCMVNTEARNKDIQLLLLDIFSWLVDRTKRLNNKQFVEMVFIELEDVLNEMDKKRSISNDFGDKIIHELSNWAEQSDSDSHLVVFHVVEMFSNFLKENKELHFVHNDLQRKEKLYKGLYNIATSCIENDFEEGIRRCSNTIGWFTIYSIKQGNSKLTKYLIKLAKGMLEISVEMNVSTKTLAFLLTLFTTVGMYCCKDSANYIFIDSILDAIKEVDKKLVYTAIKIRTYENDMWDGLMDKNTQHLAGEFRKRYESYQSKRK